MSITMNITDRIESVNPESTPEDFLSSSLSVIFPDAVANQHGDVHNALIYSSPRLPRRLRIDLSDPPSEEDRLLFGHYLWNASLLAAELVEGGTLGPAPAPGNDEGVIERRDGLRWEGGKKLGLPLSAFDVRDKTMIELGAGTALPSTMATLLGAKEVCVTDYPSPALMETLKANVARNTAPENAPSGKVCPNLEVTGHSWGKLEGFEAKKHAYDIVVAADCLWMPWQHQNLLTSTSHFLSTAPGARAWVIAGFHTGRRNMRGFFDAEFLRSGGLEVEALWEVDCVGEEREWVWEREGEEVARWTAIGVLKRVES